MKTRTVLKCLTLTIFISICNNLKSQDFYNNGIDNNIFEKIDYNTISAPGLFTGSQNISIPITKIEENGVTIPIYLSYNSKGNKVSSNASWVGLGWSLNTGGCITRQVRGIPDDYNKQDAYWGYYNDNMFSGMLYDGYYYENYNIANDIFNLDPTQNSATNYNLLKGIFSKKYDIYSWLGSRDLEPDIFHFNINGKSGEFYFDKNKQIHCVPYFNLKVNYTLGTRNIQSFTITNDDGTIYNFNDAEQTVLADKWSYTPNYTVDEGSNIANETNLRYTYNSAWFLSKITTANGATINYTYADESYTYNSPDEFATSLCADYPLERPQKVSSGSMNMTTKRLTNITGTNISIDFNPYSAVRQDFLGPDFNIHGVYTSIVIGQEYPVPGVSAPFVNYVQGTHALCSIIIKNKDNVGTLNPIKRYSLSYNYFTSSYSNQCHDVLFNACETKRLKLYSVTESDETGNNAKPPYTLTYNESTMLPVRFSHERDLYGYYNANGADATCDFNPKVYVYNNDNSDSHHVRVLPSSNSQDNLLFTKTGMDLSPNPAKMDACILKSMTLPVGGTVSYEYEPDQGVYTNGGAKEVITGGGLRLKSISYNDGVSTSSIVKSFNYNGSGVINYMPEFTHFAYHLCGGPGNHATINSDFYKSFMYRRSSPYNYFDGPTVVYSKVTVSTTNACKTDYVFETGNKTNIQNDNVQYCTAETPSSYINYYTDVPLKSNIPFAPDVNYAPFMGSLVCKTDFDISGNPVHRVLNTYKNIFPSSTNNYNLLYGLAIRFLALTSKNSKNADGSTPVALLHQYGFVKYKIVTDIQRVPSTSIETSFDPKDSTKFVSTTKTYDYSNGQVSSVIQDLSDGNQLKTVYRYAKDVEDQIYCDPEDDDDILHALHVLQGTNLLNTVVEEIKYKKINDNWNVIGANLNEFNYAYRNNMSYSYLVNQYKLQTTKPILENTFQPEKSDFVTLKFDDKYSLTRSNILYDNAGNIIQYSDINSPMKSFIYGYISNNPIAEFENTTYSAISSNTTLINYINQLQTYTNMSDPSVCSNLKTLNNNIRTNLPANVLVTTYTYSPIIGVTSSTDPRGVTTYYNYDNFGRLNNVKDLNNILLKQNRYHYQEKQ